MILVGAAALFAAAAWVIVLLSPTSDRPNTDAGENVLSDAPMTTLAANGYALPAAAARTSQSLVQLQAFTSHGEVSLVGVAVAEGGLVATTASSLTSLREIDMVGPNGHLIRASVVAIDRTSDVALVNVPDDIPVAQFADDSALRSGSTDMTLSMARPNSEAAAVQCTPGTVAEVGKPISGGLAQGMPAITSSGQVASAQSGDPLLNSSGAVIGILYYAGATSIFLPSQLVLGVADDLRSNGRVTHGWLGVEGSEGLPGGGATVSTIMSGSPAESMLHPGEVITALSGVPVSTMAELRGRLYVLPPHSHVTLSVLNGSVASVVDVTLSPSP
jgi:serine protease Do